MKEVCDNSHKRKLKNILKSCMRYSKIQDLPTKWAHFCLNISSFVHRQAGVSLKGKKVLAGFSGGPDSAALVLAMHYLAPSLNMKLEAAYLDHGLRREAGEDLALVQDTCSQLSMKLHLGRSNVSRLAGRGRGGIEETARRLRYRYLHGVARKTGADYVLTGHHLNDLAEDILMRLQRGTGWPGLSGMRAYVPERRILRPLLMIPRKCIMDFLETAGQGYVLDATNKDKTFLRNRVRMSLVPEFEAINPGFLKSIANIWRLGRVDADYWDHILEEARQDVQEEDLVPGDLLSGMHQAARMRLYKKTLDSLGPGQALVENIFKLDELWQSRKTGARVQFPGDKEALISREGIEFRHISHGTEKKGS